MVSVYKIWILQKDSGLCLVDATIEEFPNISDQNALLISGLLTSFMHFTTQIIGEEMRLFETETFRIIFSTTEDLMFALAMERKGSVQFAEKILKRLHLHFIEKYGTEIETSFSGDITAFPDINNELEEMLQLGKVKLVKQILQKERKYYAGEFKKTIQKMVSKK